ncbi:MAG: hypothetical protein HYS27_23290 [Deltaproteobacteria bacterium]|nr:hypothetical protein [Deltaproteobacteria bacterium]
MIALTAALCLAAAPVLPHAVGTTRGGLPLVVVSAPASPWAELQLHVALDAAELSPTDRSRLVELASALAGSIDLSPVGGVARARAAPDHLVVSWGAPAAALDALVRGAQDALLRHRMLKPARVPVATAKSSEPDLDARALALAFSSTPLMLAVAGGAGAEPLGLLAARVLRRERLAIAVVGPLPEAELLERCARTLTAGFVPGASAATSVPSPVTGVRVAELADADVAGARSTVWFVGQGRGGPGASPADRAARAVLARLVSGRAESSAIAFAIAVDVTSPRASTIARAEGKLLAAFEDIARTPPPADLVVAEAARERAARLERLQDVEALADAHGRALLAGDAALVDRELEALAAVTPDAVAGAARAAALGPRVVWRVVGGGG